MTFINRVIKEATLDKDMEAEQKSQAFISKVFELVQQFPKSKFISYNPKPEQNFIIVKVGNLTFQLFDSSSPHSQSAGMNAGFVPRNNTVNVFNVEISYDKASKKLSLNVPENQKEEIKHEIIHFLDLKRTGKEGTEDYLKKLGAYDKEYEKWAKANSLDPKSQLVQTMYQNRTGKSIFKPREQGEYQNDNYEMNAHFMEYVMPKMNKYILNKGEIPKQFDGFKKEILDDNSEFKNYYSHLEDKNKKKFLKRLAVYYQSLRDFILKTPNVKFDKASTTLDINKNAIDKAVEKLSTLFKKNKAA